MNKLYLPGLLLSLLAFASCSLNDLDISGDDTGTGGSLARFTVTNNRLYVVDNTNLKTYDISDPSQINYMSNYQVGWRIETIYPKGDSLYIGSQNSMYIYDISYPDNPEYKSSFTHTYSCDPVVSDGLYAYVTLSSSSTCGATTNQLQVYDIKNTSLIQTINMTSPKGLALNDNILYVCDDDLLKVFNVDLLKSGEANAKVNQYRYRANDLIVNKNVLIAVSDSALYQFSIQGKNLQYLSTLSVK
jgi:hypothetical protein